MIKITHKGNFKKTLDFLQRNKDQRYLSEIDQFAMEGVNALSNATPMDSGSTSNSWTYKIERKKGSITIYWYNTNEIDGVNIAMILQYGHGTGTGGYVRGIDYINPALQPVFDKIADRAWKAVIE